MFIVIVIIRSFRCPIVTVITVFICTCSLLDCYSVVRLLSRKCEIFIPDLNKKAQLTLSNPRDVKACKNCSNSTCFVSFHRIPFHRISKFRPRPV